MKSTWTVHARGRLVHGAGINDADYAVAPVHEGRQVMCPFYRAWHAVLERCYSDKWHAKHSTYLGCSVSDEWKSFMRFRDWMSKKNWQGMHLDKDILYPGNKQYGPGQCVFVPPELNRFVTDSAASQGQWPLGVYLHKTSGRFRAQCNNPFTLKREHLGRFTCAEEAHLAWKKRKHELAMIYAAQQSDPRIAKALSTRYLINQGCAA